MRQLYFLLMLMLVSSALAATPNPGHDASRIGPGSFPEGNYTFNGSITVYGDSQIALPAVNGTAATYLNYADGNNYLRGDTYFGNDANVLRYVSGFVGIGTTAPTLRLDILGASGGPATSGTAQTGVLRVRSSGGHVLDFGVTNADPWGTWIQSVDSNDLSVERPLLLNPNGGVVGIGTASPSQALHVTGAANITTALYTPQICLNGDCQTSWPSSSSANTTGAGTANYVARFVNSTHITTGTLYDNSTNVGIGTTTPARILTVNGSTNTARILIQNNQAGSSIGDGLDLIMDGQNASVWNYESGFLRLGANNLEHVRIDSAGNVGVGNTNPIGIFDVDSDADGWYVGSANHNTINRGGGDVDNLDLWINYVGYNGGTSRFRDFRVGDGKQNTIAFFDGSSRSVGIGTNSPTAVLDVRGATKIQNVTVDFSAPTGGGAFFSMQPYIEAETIPWPGSSTTTAFATMNTSAAPFSKVANSSSHVEFPADYIPVQPGETLYGELWAMRETGTTGGGLMYAGVARYDKDKRPIDGNLGLTYFIASGVNVSANSQWTKYSGTTTVPLTHTPHDGSDGGPVRYVRPYIIVNYPSGTQATYWGGMVVRSVQQQRDNGSVAFNGNVGIGTVAPAPSAGKGLHISGGNLDGSGGPAVVRLSETGSGLGNFELRSTRTAATSGNRLDIGEGSDTFLTVRGDDDGGTTTTRGYVGIGTTSPTGHLHVQDSNDNENTALTVKAGPSSTYDPVIRLEGESAIGTEGFTIRYDNDVGDAYINQVYTGITGTVPAIRFSTGNTANALVLTGGGHVGIGTTNPVAADGSARTLQLGNNLVIQNVVGTQAMFSKNAHYDGTWKRATAATASAIRFGHIDGVSFHVAPTGAAGSTISNWDTSDVKMVIEATGDVGIGTDNPTTAKLQISGGGISTQDSSRTSAGVTFNSVIGSADIRTLLFNGAGSSSVWWAGSGTPQFAIDSISGGGASFWTNNGAWSRRMDVAADGDVGISVSDPLARLHVFGGSIRHEYSGTNEAQYGFYTAIDNNHFTENAYYDGSWRSIEADRAYVAALAGSADWAFAVSADTSVSGASEVLDLSTLFVIEDGGDVGVGTSTPVFRLQTSGALNAGDGPFVLTSGSEATTFYDAHVDGTSAYLHTPGAMMRKDSSGTRIDQAPAGLVIYNGNGADSTWMKLSLASREASGAGNPVSIAGIAAQKTSGTSGAWASGDLVLWAKSGSSQVEVLRAASTNRVGIGDSVPDSKLDIHGKVTIVPNDGTADNYNEGIRIAEAANGYSVIQLGGGEATTGTGAGQWTILSDPTDDFEIRENGDVHLGILDNGNVAIGSSDPNYKLDVQGQLAVDAPSGYGSRVVVGQTGTDYPGNSGWASSFNSNILLNALDTSTIGFHDSGVSVGTLGYVANQFFVDGSASWGPVELGINTRSPTQSLDVSGDVRIRGNDITDSADTTRLSIGSNVVVTVG